MRHYIFSKFILNTDSSPYLLLCCGCMLMLMAWGFSGILLTPISSLDDAFISLHNTQLLVNNFGSISTHALVGSTSIVHTIELSVALFMGIQPETALAIIGFINAILYICACALLIPLYITDHKQQLVFLVLAFVFAMTPYQLSNGLETGLAMAAVMWCIFVYNCGGRLKFFGLPTLLGIMPLIRPELGALSALLTLIYLQDLWLQRSSFRQFILMVVISLALILLVLAPFLLILYIDSGNILPHTASAKKYFFADGCTDLYARTKIFLQKSLVIFVTFAPAFWAFPALYKSRLGKVLMVFVGIFLLAYWWNMPSAIEHYLGRYAYILQPIFFYSILLYWQQHKLRAFSVFSIFLLVHSLLICLPLNIFQYQYRTEFMRENHRATALWINENLPSGATILVHDVGYLTYIDKKHRIVDMVGLKTPQVASIHKNITWPSCSAERSVALKEIVKKYQPDYMVVSKLWDDQYHFTRAIGGEKDLEKVYGKSQGLGFSIYRFNH